MDDRSRNAPHVVIEVDDGLRVVGWNRRAEQVFGVRADEAVGRAVAELLPVQGAAAAWTATLEADSDAPQVRPIARAGAERMFESWSQVTRDADGRPVGATIYGHDVTARIAAERRPQLEARILDVLVNNLDVTAWALDKRGVFLYQDGKALAKTGISPHQLIGVNLFEQFEREIADSPIRRAMAGEPVLGRQSEQRGVQWVHWYVPVPDDPDIGLVAVSLDVTEAKRREAELQAKIDVIEKQQEVIRELSTPIIEVWDHVLTLPIVGLVDSVRTAEIMDNLLQTVSRTRARFAILDLTGVEVVDTGTASHLIGMIHALRLLGAEGILTGIHPTIAQTIVALGVDLTRVAVFAKLRDALHHCIAQLDGRRPRK